MKRAFMIAALTAAFSLTMAGGVLAGTQDGALITLHAKGHTTKAATVCTTWRPTTIPCSNYNIQWPVGVSTDVYLTVARGQAGPGIAGLSCGVLYYRDIGCFGWTLCADLECPTAGANGNWPASGGGNRIVWSTSNNCQRTAIGMDGVHAIAGAFYLYAYGDAVFEITDNNNLVIPELAVVDCAGSITYMGYSWCAEHPRVGFGYQPGCNPCSEACEGICDPPPWWSSEQSDAQPSAQAAWADCWVVPTQPTTWGRIKARY